MAYTACNTDVMLKHSKVAVCIYDFDEARDLLTILDAMGYKSSDGSPVEKWIEWYWDDSDDTDYMWYVVDNVNKRYDYCTYEDEIPAGAEEYNVADVLLAERREADIEISASDIADAF